MRADMDKVIVERPRFGSRAKSRKKGYRKYVASTPVDELPNREPMLGRWHGMEKQLNEHLGPMKRFLTSNVGRPWEKVHQELCEHISFANAVQSHVLDHIYDFVQQHVTVISSSHVQPQVNSWWHRGRLRPGEMYICPATRLLKVVKRPRQQTQISQFVESQHVRFLKRDDVWWEVRVCRLPEEISDQWDVWMERDVQDLHDNQDFPEYGKDYFAVSKRLLKPFEIKSLHRKHRKRKRQR